MKETKNYFDDNTIRFTKNNWGVQNLVGILESRGDCPKDRQPLERHLKHVKGTLMTRVEASINDLSPNIVSDVL